MLLRIGGAQVVLLCAHEREIEDLATGRASLKALGKSIPKFTAKEYEMLDQ